MSSGTVEIAISFMGTDIFSKSDDLCTKTACPVRKGPTEITLVELLPPIAPPVSGPVGLLLPSSGCKYFCLR